jgi:hypothetical protein
LTSAARQMIRSATATLRLTLAVTLLVGSLILAAPAGAQGHRAGCTATSASHATRGRYACTHARHTHKGGKHSSANATGKVGGQHSKSKHHRPSTESAAGTASEAQTSEEAEEEEEALEAAGEEGNEAGEES